MTRYVARHAVPNSGRRKAFRGRALAVVVVALAPVALAPVIATVPVAPSAPAYADERWQDPSGFPYCVHPDDGLRPCVEAQGGAVRP